MGTFDASELRSGAAALEALATEELFPGQRGERTAVAPTPFGVTRSMIGRRAELGQLFALAHRAATTTTAITVVVGGAAGAGKTRLLREFCGTLPGREAWRILNAEAREDLSPWAPISSWLMTWAGIRADQPLDVNHQRLLAACERNLPPHLVTESAHLIAHALDLGFANSAIVTPLVDTPQTLNSRLFLAVRRVFGAIAQQQPLILCADHVEAIMPETARLVRYLMNGVSGHPVLLVFATRDQAHLDLATGDETQATALHLGDLAPIDLAELVAALCPGVEVPALVTKAITALGPSPRHATEVIRLLAEAGHLRRDAAPGDVTLDHGSAAAGSLLDTAAIQVTPFMLTATQGHALAYHDLVWARLSVMDPDVRAVLERASVLGTRCWVDALIALGRSDYVTVDTPDGHDLAHMMAAPDQITHATLRALDVLTDGEWMQRSERSSLPGETDVVFTNPDLCTMVYAAIEPTRRREYHRVAAHWLQLTPVAREAGAHTAIAHHLVAAERPIDAAQAFRRAGDGARDRFANHEALAAYQQALAYLGDRDLATRLHLWHEVGGLHERMGDLDAALGGFERMLRLAWIAASKVKAAVACNRIGRIWRRRAEVKLAATYLDRAAELFRIAGDARGIATSLDDLGRLLQLQGQFEPARRHLEDALALRQQVGDGRSIATSLAALGALAEDRGDLGVAQRHYQEALARHRAVNDTIGAMRSQLALAALASQGEDPAVAKVAWQQALQAARDLGVVASVGRALYGLGELAVRTQHWDEALRYLGEALRIATDIDEADLEAECRRGLSEVQLRLGNIGLAAEFADASLAQAKLGNMRHLQAKALLALAKALSTNLFDPDKTADVDPAQPPRPTSLFREAISLWRELGKQPEQSVALLEYGRYCVERGMPADAVEALREALVLSPGLTPTQRHDAVALLRTLGADPDS